MTELLEMLINYLAIWAPSLVGVFGLIVTFIKASKETRTAIGELKNSKQIKELTCQVKALISENKQLREAQAVLVDQMTKIQNYLDNKEHK